MEKLVDFSFVDHLCQSLYSSRGPRPYAPSLKLKIHIVQKYYNLSDREMEEKILGDLFIKRFLGVPANFFGFDHSTIGLDRERMGSDLFDACHHYIVAQARKQGLWGDSKEVWYVDTFHTNGHIAPVSAYGMIRQGILRLLNQLERAHLPLYQQAMADLDFSLLSEKLPYPSSKEDLEIAFSQLVVLGFALLYWFESEHVHPVFWAWDHSKRQLACLENQANLYRIMTEHIVPNHSDPQLPYKKLPRDQRSNDRPVSAVDPEVRYGSKRNKRFLGDKIQVVTPAKSRIVLDAEPIPGNEADGDRLPELIFTTSEKQGTKPEAVGADSAYGYAENRIDLKKEDILLIAPLQKKANPTGLYSHEQFAYDEETDVVTCPNGITTSEWVRNSKNKGRQFKFPKSACSACPFREACTTNKSGRTVFISDYYEVIKEAAALNETEDAKKILSERKRIEPKNNELKNHQGLGDARMRTREKRRSETKIACIVVNLKQMIKHAGGSLTLDFKRKRPSPA
jgi:hypothetical protein